MGLVSNLRYITSHPLNRDNKIKPIARWAKWQIISRIRKSYQEYEWIGGIKVITKNGDRGFTGNIYTLLQDYEEMSLLIDFMNEGETFIDVGANIGTYSLLAGKLCNAKVIAFEPIGESYKRLKNNIKINSLEDKIDARKICLGEKPGQLIMSSSRNTQNSVIDKDIESIPHETVEASTLDKEVYSDNPTFIKIDVEGFESSVIKGGEKLLSSESLEIVIIETCRGDEIDESYHDIKDKLIDYGFKHVGYDPREQKITKYGSEEIGKNSIFIRNEEKIRKRLKNATLRKELGL